MAFSSINEKELEIRISSKFPPPTVNYHCFGASSGLKELGFSELIDEFERI